MLDTPCSEVVWRVLATHSIRQFHLHFPSRASPCAITFQLESTTKLPAWLRDTADNGRLNSVQQSTYYIGTFVDQVKPLLALSSGRFEAIRRKTHCIGPFKKHLVKGRKVIAPEIFKSDTFWKTDKGYTINKVDDQLDATMPIYWSSN